MICIKCKQNSVDGRRARICDECLSDDTRRYRRRRLTPEGLVRGTHWRYKRVPMIEGIVDSVLAAGYVHLEIADELGEFTWKSTIEHFLQSWEKIEPQSDLDRQVQDHVNQMRHVPLRGQKSLLT